MFLKCSNPECQASFDDYRQGRLYRFHRSHAKGRAPANTHFVQHFWLCNGCAETYALEYRRGRVKLTIRDRWKFTNDRGELSDGGSLDSDQNALLFSQLRLEDSTD